MAARDRGSVQLALEQHSRAHWTANFRRVMSSVEDRSSQDTLGIGGVISVELDGIGFGLGEDDVGEFFDAIEDGFGDSMPAVDWQVAISMGGEDDGDGEVDVIGGGLGPIDGDSDGVGGLLAFDGWFSDQVGHAGDVHGLDLARAFGLDQLLGHGDVPGVGKKLEGLTEGFPLDGVGLHGSTYEGRGWGIKKRRVPIRSLFHPL